MVDEGEGDARFACCCTPSPIGVGWVAMLLHVQIHARGGRLHVSALRIRFLRLSPSSLNSSHSKQIVSF
eukprot:m.221547 g.221547  ORF g.221547 m.221547 type:complete len:69 (+) comp15129_c0_seq1:4480-4686(+)